MHLSTQFHSKSILQWTICVWMRLYERCKFNAVVWANVSMSHISMEQMQQWIYGPCVRVLYVCCVPESDCTPNHICHSSLYFCVIISASGRIFCWIFLCIVFVFSVAVFLISVVHAFQVSVWTEQSFVDCWNYSKKTELMSQLLLVSHRNPFIDDRKPISVAFLLRFSM